MASVRVLALAVAAGYLFYRYLIYPAFVSPLSKIPSAHPTARYSPLWIIWTRLGFRENRSIFAAHGTHGPVVLLGPNELSVNCVDNGLRSIYAGGYDKHDFYDLFANYNGVDTMFSMRHSKPHSHRKRMISNVYAKTSIQSSRGFALACQQIVHDRLVPETNRSVEAGGAIDLYKLLNFATMDIVTAYMFGVSSGSNFLQNHAAAEHWLDLYSSRKKFVFWPQEMPGLTSLLAKFGINLSPKWVAEANGKLEDWCLELCDAANGCIESMTDDDERDRPQDTPNVFRQLRTALYAEASKAEKQGNGDISPERKQEIRLALASEMLDELSAGHETSSITMAFLFHELCLHPEIQESLRAELASLPSLHHDSTKRLDQQPPLPSAKALDSLPLLDAVLQEALRLHAAIPGPQPRVTPSVPSKDLPSYNQVQLGPYTSIPANVRVSCSAYTLHRNAAVYPDPLSFNPARWLPLSATSPTNDDTTSAQRAEQHRWFWAFGSGGRMCIGKNLALQQMKLLVAVLVANFAFGEVLDVGHADAMRQEDAYTAQPEGGKLVVRVSRV